MGSDWSGNQRSIIGDGIFFDVPADAYYAKAVAWTVKNGACTGMGSGKFSPDATCMRAQTVTFLRRGMFK